MKTKILTLCTVIICSVNSEALELEEALSTTYTKNQNLKIIQQKFLADIEAFPQALAEFLPSVTASVKVDNSKQKYESHLTTASSDTGADVTRSFTVQQPLFSGGRSVAGLKIAQAGFWVARSKLYSSEQDILNSAVKAYLSVCSSTEKFAIASDAVEFSKQNLNMVEEKLKVGEVTITDLALARATLAKAEADKSAQYAKLLSNKAVFKTVVGIDPPEDLKFPSLPEGLPKDYEVFNENILKSNLDLLSAKYTLVQSKAGVTRAYGALLPTASIQAQASKNYYENDPRRTPTPARQNFKALSTSLAVNIPIFDKGGAEYSNIRTNKKQNRQAVYGLEYAQNQLKSQAIGVWEIFKASQDSIIFVDKYVEAQTLALEGLRQEYLVGSKNMLEVLKAQDELNNARSQSVDVREQYILGAYALKQLMGQGTAQQLKLKAKYFSPEQEFKRIKHKIIGF